VKLIIGPIEHRALLTRASREGKPESRFFRANAPEGQRRAELGA
jgi:hypothetical protein